MLRIRKVTKKIEAMEEQITILSEIVEQRLELGDRGGYD